MLISLRTRIFLSHLLVAVIGTVTITAILSSYFEKQQIISVEHALLNSANALAHAVETDIGTAHGKIIIEHAVEKLRHNDNHQFAVMDTFGNVISSTAIDIKSGSLPPGRKGVQTEKPTIYYPLVTSIAGGCLIVDVSMKRNRAVVGTVRAWMLKNDYEVMLDTINHITALVFAGVAALSVALSIFIASALTAPINKMRKLTKRISEGDFEVRLGKGRGDKLDELADDFNTMAEHLQEVENSRRNFFGNVSHELRSPVSNIRITSEVLARRAERIDADSVKMFETIVSETERLESLINELMDIAAIQSGSLRLNVEVFDLKTLLDDLIDRLQQSVKRKNIELIYIADSDMNLVADRKRIERAISNLLDNAVKYTPNGGRVTLLAKNSGDHIMIDVKDTGCGIPEEEISKIFERYYRTGASRDITDGVGIGLALVKHLTETHGGTVTVSSTEDQGSTFSIRLPLK